MAPATKSVAAKFARGDRRVPGSTLLALKASQRLGQRIDARPMSVGSGAAVGGYVSLYQSRVQLFQHIGCKTDSVRGARAQVGQKNVGLGRQPAGHFLPMVGPGFDGHRALVGVYVQEPSVADRSRDIAI